MTLLMLSILAVYSHYMASDPFERSGPALVFTFMLSGRLVISYQVTYLYFAIKPNLLYSLHYFIPTLFIPALILRIIFVNLYYFFFVKKSYIENLKRLARERKILEMKQQEMSQDDRYDRIYDRNHNFHSQHQQLHPHKQ